MDIQTQTLLQAARDWLAAFVQPSLWAEVAALALALVLAWLLTAALRRLFTQDDADPNSILFGRRLVDGVLFPLALLGLAYAGRSVLLHWGMPLGLFRVAMPALLSLAAIRTGVKVLQVAMHDAPWVRAMERTNATVRARAAASGVAYTEGSALGVQLANVEATYRDVGISDLNALTARLLGYEDASAMLLAAEQQAELTMTAAEAQAKQMELAGDFAVQSGGLLASATLQTGLMDFAKTYKNPFA